VSEQPPPLRQLRPKINTRLEYAVGRALMKDPAQRYATADDFIAALEEARASIRSGENGAGGTASFPPVEQPYYYEEGPDERGARWPLVLLALLLLAVGLVAALWHPWTAKQVAVPSVVHQRAAAATVLLRRDGFKVRTHPVQSDTVKVGLVAAQHPPAGQRVDEGSTVLLDVSSGPGQVLIPVVANFPKDEAQQILNQSGFKVTVDQRPSPTVAKGLAIKTSPPESTPAPRGSRVRLFISSGPPNVRVPDVVGQDKDAARLTLEGAGFKVTTKLQTSAAPKGQVIAENPPGGSSLLQGSTVQVTVSKGQPKVVVEDVTGQTKDQARATLEGQGLKVKAVKETSTQTPGTVIRQSPPGGSKITKGSTVTIFVAQKQPTSGGTGPGGGGGGTGTGQNGNGQQGQPLGNVPSPKLLA
jgi:serine/threonine-protein kinase